jgi:hypothetical protein
MSILINVDAMPNRIRALAEIAASESEISRGELERRFAPNSKATKTFRDILREAIRLNVLIENKETKNVSLSPDLSKKQVSNRTDFLGFCRACLIQNSGKDCHGNEAFPRALAWLLTRPIGPQLAAGSEFEVEIMKDLSGDEIYELTNASRSSVLVYWAQALGFAEWLKFDEKNYCNPDPTRVLRASLGKVLEKKHQTPIADALEKIAREVPVFETGRIRKEVEARLNTPREPKYLSQSTSLALSRLALNGTIKLDHLADAPTLLLSTLDKRDEAVSHVTLIKS